jgi:geranylgeranyl reductase family protein
MMYDVIIVGAGPAGSTAAKHLATANLKVLLLDKSKFPRTKPCGGGLTPHMWARHPELLQYIENYNYAGVINVEGSPKSMSYKSDNVLGAYCIRKKFDHFLVKDAIKAGAEFKEEEFVTDISFTSNSVVVKTKTNSFEGQVLLGADGANSTVGKLTGLNPGWAKKDFTYCLEVEEEFPEDVILKYYGKEYTTIWHFGFQNTKGIGYIFPKKNVINIGFGAITSEDIPYRELMMKYIDFCEQNNLAPKFTKREISAGIYPICGPLKTFIKERCMLLGDAAGFVNPMNGEGIHFAIYSGDLASHVLVNAFKKKDFSKKMFLKYQKICMQLFGNYLRRCTGLQKNILKGNFLMTKYGSENEQIKLGMTDIFDEKMDPRKVSRKMMWALLKEIIKAKLVKKDKK